MGPTEMVRLKSTDKQKAILDAAITLFAERGLASTPTSAISKAADVAEGTLFTYFKTKDDLINELYRHIKGEFAQIILVHFPVQADCRTKFFHFWQKYLNWAVENPEKCKVMNQLKVSEKITDETRKLVAEPFSGLEQMIKEAITRGELKDYPLEFIAATMSSIAESTIPFMTQSAAARETYCRFGFEIFWNGIAGPAATEAADPKASSKK